MLNVEAIPPDGYIAGLETNTPPPGYKGILLPKMKRANIAGHFETGECPTNSILLKLRKLEEDEK
jgi:hypothetical protein